MTTQPQTEVKPKIKKVATKKKGKPAPKQKMFVELDRVLDQIARDKNIPKERLVEAVESAFLSAARKKWGHLGELEAHYNQENGEIELFQFKTVVAEIKDSNLEISLEEGQKLDPEVQAGDSLGVKMDPSVFGRIAAQAAKQVIISKVRDAEKDLIFKEYKDRVGEIVTGIVRRYEKGGDLVIDVGRSEACVPRTEQVTGEPFKIGDRVQAYFMEINPHARGPMIILSRRHPQLVKKLFELEVPEVADGTVEIKNVAREPGIRAKIAVTSKDSDVDPVGACVGMKGSRVQSVVQELRGEKIDIVCWDEDPARFVCNAIAPAEVVKVIVKERERSMEVVVPDDQLSLAIGKRGQNVRLAAHLTGWNVDVYSETKIEELATRCKAVLARVLNVDDSMAFILYSHGFRHFEDIARVEWNTFKDVPSVSAEKLKEMKGLAEKAVVGGLTTEKVMGEILKEKIEKEKIESEKKRMEAESGEPSSAEVTEGKPETENGEPSSAEATEGKPKTETEN